MLKGGTNTSLHTSLLLGFKGTKKRCCKNRHKKLDQGLVLYPIASDNNYS